MAHAGISRSEHDFYVHGVLCKRARERHSVENDRDAERGWQQVPADLGCLVIEAAGCDARGPAAVRPKSYAAAPVAVRLRPPAFRDLDVDTDQVVGGSDIRSEEHTSELQSRLHLVCRLLLEKK